MPDSRAVLDADRNVSAAVVEAVAEAEGVSPMELQPPLHYSVDVDALDELFRPRRNAGDGNPVISFVYAGYVVTVREGEIIVVREIDDGEIDDGVVRQFE
jgi:hypothetical protein